MLQGIAEALAILALTYIVISYLFKPKGMPPGPLSLPIVGNLITLILSGNDALKRTHVILSNLAKKYGDVFMLELPGLQRVVVVSSIERAREALLTKRDDFAGRPKTFILDFLSMGSKDLASGDFSPTLVLQRKIVHSAIRMYQPFLEEKIISEVNEMIQRISPGKLTNPKEDVLFVTTNVIFQIAVGQRFEQIDEEFMEKLNLTRRYTNSTGPFNILNFLPFLIHFPIVPSTALKKLRDDLHQFIFGKYHEHKGSYQDGVIRDLTDALIKARHDGDQEDSSNFRLINEEHIVMTVMDVFIAGLETTATALLWFMLYMVKYPEVQFKIHEELDSVLGPDTLPLWKHRIQLPYLVATIDETLRKASIASFLLPHKATKDSTLAGFSIPKGTYLMFNVWAMHQDDQEWIDPGDFNPSRFVNNNGKVDQNVGSKSFLPFGMGRRVCAGETLAKQELFVITSRLLHEFTLHKAPGPLPQITDDLTGIIHYPPSYEICFKPRQ